MAWTLFWFSKSESGQSVKDEPSLPSLADDDSNSEDPMEAEIFDALRTELESEMDNMSSNPEPIHGDLPSIPLEPTNDEGKEESVLTKCDFAPMLSFTYQETWSSTENGNGSCILDMEMCDDNQELNTSIYSNDDLPKLRELRLVDGRLQVVGFCGDIPECTNSRRPLRKSRKLVRGRPFWSEVMHLLTK
jgi:hypothetical protein